MDPIPANVERGFVSLRDAMNRLVEESVLLPSRFGWPREEGQAWRIPIDLLETHDQFIVTASLPGVKPEEVQVSATWANGVLTLTLPKAEAAKPHPIQVQVKH